jgi:uracil-DNA glycosylase
MSEPVPFAATSGPRDALLVLLGEAHGESEEQWGLPFAGQSGRELFRMLGDAGFSGARELASIRSDQAWLAAREEWLQAEGILLTNVFAFRPERNNLAVLCGKKEEMEREYDLPPLRTENPRYVRAGIALPQLRRLASELTFAPRNLILCLGATALWALSGRSTISSLRGAVSSGRVLKSGRAAGPPGRGGGDAPHAAAAPARGGGVRGPRAGDAIRADAERDSLEPDERLELDGPASPARTERAGTAGLLVRADEGAGAGALLDHRGRGVRQLGAGSRSGAEAPGPGPSSPPEGEFGPAEPRSDRAVEQLQGEPGPEFKFLPTYHPAAIFRAWHWRPIVLADLLKAHRERHSGAICRPRRGLLVSPSVRDVEEWTRRALKGENAAYGWSSRPPARLLAPDIETLKGQIRCIGFARSREDVLVVPFIARLSGGSYWPSEQEELRAWQCVRALLESEIPKVFQNGLFDLQYLAPFARPVNCLHDTMLLHHALFPEMQKGLGFLGSVYTNEHAWKLLRRHGEELKKDE